MFAVYVNLCYASRLVGDTSYKQYKKQSKFNITPHGENFY